MTERTHKIAAIRVIATLYRYRVTFSASLRFRHLAPCALMARAGAPGMPVKKPLVIVTRKLPEAVETRMRELFDARLNLDDKPMTAAALAGAMASAQGLV